MSRTLHEVALADSGATVRAGVGDALALTLPETAGTGYLWELRVDGPARITADVIEAPPGSPPGGSRLRRIEVRFEGSGTCRVEAELRRPWERDGMPVERFVLVAEVE